MESNLQDGIYGNILSKECEKGHTSEYYVFVALKIIFTISVCGFSIINRWLCVVILIIKFESITTSKSQ